MRTIEQKLACLKKSISNSKEHLRVGDPRRIYSQYLRYAMDEFADLNFFTSKEASGLKRKEIIHEHVVPHSIVMEKLLCLNDPTNNEILAVLNKYYIICQITKDQDKELNKAGLRSKMPIGWDEEKDSVFARYHKVGISVISEKT